MMAETGSQSTATAEMPRYEASEEVMAAASTRPDIEEIVGGGRSRRVRKAMATCHKSGMEQPSSSNPGCPRVLHSV
jgi:hypothetical protein